MPNGHRSAAIAALTAVVTATLTTVAALPAAAAPADCQDVRSAKDATSVSCIAALRTRAEAATRAASITDEAYNRARDAAQQATDRATVLQDAADEAEQVATVSRARAAAVTAQLARGGGAVGQTTQVLLSGGGAGEMLYHLSRMDELTVDTNQLSATAARDSRAADALEAQAGLAADRAVASAAVSKQAFDDAKAAAQAAVTLVQQTESKRDAASASASASSAEANAFVDLPADASAAAKVVAFARSQIGDPYVFGAAGPGSWDCSGLSMMAYHAAGIGIGGHSATAQYRLAASRGLLVPYSQAQPGDLVFYGSGGDMFHVAIYSGGGNMVEAPHPGASVREVAVRPGSLAPMVARFTG